MGVVRKIIAIINKILAAVVMSLVGWFVIGLPVMLIIMPTQIGNSKPAYGWLFLGPGIAVVATLAIVFLAPTGRIAWGRLFLLNGLVSLALPLAGFAYTAMFGHQMLQHAEGSQAAEPVAMAGAMAATGLAAGIVGGMLGIVGFFLGAIFLVLAFFTLRDASRPISRSRKLLNQDDLV